MKRLLLLTLLLASAVSLGCAHNPATGRSQFMLISSQQVAALGNEAKPELVKEYGGEVPSSELRAYVRGVGERLAKHVEPEFADIEWSFTVLNSDVINAFALPGGNVFITRGLLSQFENEAQVAGVLGHEIGHVTGRHVDERISQAVAAELGLGVLGQLTESQLVLMGAQLASGGYQLSFGRNQETESDVLGVRYMTLAGYDPHGMIEVLEVLDELSQGQAPPEFLSTHPHPASRIRTVNDLLKGNYAHTQNNPEFRKYRSRFQEQAKPHLTAASDGPPVLAAQMLWCGSCDTYHAE